MSNYVQSTNFATKDALPSGDPLKIVKGTEINTEFNNIAVAVTTKADLLSPTFTGTVTSPAFSGPLTGNVTGNLTGSVTGNVTGNVTGTAANVTGTVAIANGGTGATTAAAAFTALKQAASDTATGVVELATNAEVQTGTDTTRAVTPAGFAASSLGYGQTWQAVTRTAGTTYTNSTGRPIMLVMNINGSGSASCSASIAFNGGSAITFLSVASGTGPSACAGSIVIPPGSTYVLAEVNVTSRNVYELR